MVFHCEACNRQFKLLRGFKKHSTADIPCDLICRECGVKYNDRYAFKRHKDKKKCAAKNYTKDDIAKISSSVNNGSNNTISNILESYNNNNNVNTSFKKCQFVFKLKDINTNFINRNGIHPHETEMVSDKSKMLDGILNKLVDFIAKNGSESSYENDKLQQLFMNIIDFLYSNKDFPEYINIIEGEEDSDYNLIYSGDDFIEDVLNKNCRNKRIIIKVFKWLYHIRLEHGIQYPECCELVREHLIPYLIDCFVTNKSHIDLQATWRKNKTIIQTIGLQNLPKVTKVHQLTKEDLVHQFEDLMQKSILINKAYADKEYANMRHLLTSHNKLLKTSDVIDESEKVKKPIYSKNIEFYKAKDASFMEEILDEYNKI